MKILYHHRTQGEEPESVHIANIVTSLRRHGHEVDIVGPVPVLESRRESQRSLLGRVKELLPRPALELAQIAYNLKSLLQLAGALRRKRYDFIYERYALYNTSGVWAARWFRLPLILEVNTPYAQAWAKYYGLRFPRLARAFERYVFRNADRLFTVTQVQRGLLEGEGVAAERIVVCHNAIDPDEFRPERYAEDGLRKELGLGAVVVGFVGTMNRWQGVQGFVDVVREVAAVRKDISFLFVGDGEGRAPLEAEIKRLGLQPQAIFAGRQPHASVGRYVAAMDIGVLLDSNAYGSPMKVFEYWAMGKAVIAPRVGPVLEIMRDGETGMLIDAGDAPAMARAILRLAEDGDLRHRLGASGREHVLKHHVWMQNAAAILEAYDSCRAAEAAPAKPVSR
jgi:glycosyltransferase involved in cell wall biosynthesis